MTTPKPKAPPRNLPSWLITGLMASCAVAYVYLVFLPGQRSIRHTRNLLRDRQTQLLQSDRLAVPIKLAEDQLMQIHRIADRWQRNTPPSEELSLVYSQISEQARRAGVAIRRLEPGAPRRLTTIEQCQLELTLEGEYVSFVDFLSRLENLPPTIWVRNLQMQLQEKGEAGETLRCELSLTVFADISGHAGQASRPNT
jgi:Tfp pilus assembly protein PilO